MTQDIFNDRIQRIAQNGPSGSVIPGQVGEPDRKHKKAVKKRAKAHRTRTKRETILTSVLFGGILGAIVGLVFQEVVGVQTLLTLDWQAELALAQADLVRMATWCTLALGLAVLVVTLPARRRFRKLTMWSVAYLGTAISVNAQELLDLVPAETLAMLSGG